MMESNTGREQQEALEIGDEALDSVVGGMDAPRGGGMTPITRPTTGGGGGGTTTPTGGGGGIEGPKPSAGDPVTVQFPR